MCGWLVYRRLGYRGHLTILSGHLMRFLSEDSGHSFTLLSPQTVVDNPGKIHQLFGQREARLSTDQPILEGKSERM